MGHSRHPVVYTVLIAPFGAVTGFVSVALAFMATKKGLTVGQGAELIAIGMLPNVWKFFWAPVTDMTLSRRKWYLISLVLCAVGTFATAAVPLRPSNFLLVQAIIFATSVAATVLGFAVEAMMAKHTLPADRGRVSGWYQAGNLGGTGIGGGLGLWLLTQLPSPAQTGLILAALMLFCGAVVPLLPDVPAEDRGESVAGAVRNVASQVWRMGRMREGALSAFLCFLPLGTGAAAGVLAQADVAAHWGADSRHVELVQGFLGGLVSMVGCIVGGYGCSRIGSRVAYAAYGGIMAAVTAAMAFLPATPSIYVGGNIAYFFVNGLCYASFSAVVLDAIGTGLAATKYNVFASLSNTPIWYMGLLLAAVETRLGPKGMLLAESAFGILGILAFMAAAQVWRPKAAVPPATNGAWEGGVAQTSGD